MCVCGIKVCLFMCLCLSFCFSVEWLWVCWLNSLSVYMCYWDMSCHVACVWTLCRLGVFANVSVCLCVCACPCVCVCVCVCVSERASLLLTGSNGLDYDRDRKSVV